MDAIGDRYGLNLQVMNHAIDPTFRFMTLDWDGQIRMDPSSVYAMGGIVGLKEQFAVAFASDTDADRHGIVSRTHGLLEPNHYLSVAISYLFANRPQWSQSVAVGKTVVSSSMIDRVVKKFGRRLVEVPVGFKWFVEGLVDGSLGFVGRELGRNISAPRRTVWTTDKTGSCRFCWRGDHRAHRQRSGEHYQELTRHSERRTTHALMRRPRQSRKRGWKNYHRKRWLLGHSPASRLQISSLALRGTVRPSRLKVVTENGWFAARPSGTENIYKILRKVLKISSTWARCQRSSTDREGRAGIR